MSLLVISCSLNPKSRSRALGRIAFEELHKLRSDVGWADMVEHPLPFCDGIAAYSDPNALALQERIRSAEGILLATPIYNYDVSAVVKNLIELTGEAWTGKVVGFVCSAGGQGSYMAVMSVANSLMLDFRCLVIPRFIFATGRSFEGQTLKDAEIHRRLLALSQELVRLTDALAAARPPA